MNVIYLNQLKNNWMHSYGMQVEIYAFSTKRSIPIGMQCFRYLEKGLNKYF